jgi:hypothetical protein
MTSLSEIRQIKKCVTFIFTPSGNELIPRGTGFFVGMPLENREGAPERIRGVQGPVHIYLATAKHVVQDRMGKLLPQIRVRANTTNGGSETGFADLREDNVFFHEENEVDLAVIPVSVDPQKFDMKVVQPELISTRETLTQYDIGEGDDVMFVGLFTHHIGRIRNQPIARFGKVALIPEEKIQVGDALEDLYLMECQSFAANSGSPVFFEISLTRHPVFLSQRLFLAGLIKGHFRFDSSTENLLDLADRPNIGIAAVTPSYKLHEVLYSEKMKSYRRVAEENTFKP